MYYLNGYATDFNDHLYSAATVNFLTLDIFNTDHQQEKLVPCACVDREGFDLRLPVF